MIVALTRNKSFSFVFNRFKRRTAGEEAASVSVGVSFFGCAFCLGSGVGKGKDDRTFVDLSHFFQAFFCECAALGGNTDDGSRLDFADSFEESFSRSVFGSKRHLGRSQRSSTFLGNQSFRVKEFDAGKCFFSSQTFFNHCVGNQVSNTGCSRTCAQEQDFLILKLLLEGTHSREHTGHNNRSRSLNVVIEAGDFVFVLIEQVISMAVVEVFELDHNIGPAFSDGIHKFSNQCIVFRSGNTFLAKTHVKRVVQKFFVIGADVDTDR